jgi:hypothetical protein
MRNSIIVINCFLVSVYIYGEAASQMEAAREQV